MNKNKGFTLIELLVVVAIIGILASVVLASLSSARSKAKNAAIQSELSSLRSQAGIYYLSMGQSFENICTIDSTNSGFGGDNGILEGVRSVDAAIFELNVAGGPGDWNYITCNSDRETWAAEAPLGESVLGSPVMYCVDSTGASTTKTTVMGAGQTACAPLD